MELELLENPLENPRRRRRSRTGRFVRSSARRRSHTRRRRRRNPVSVMPAFMNPRRRRRPRYTVRHVVARRNPRLASRVGSQIKTAAIGMLGMSALDVVAPLVSSLVGGVLPGGASAGGTTASLVDPKTAGAILSLAVVAKSRPGGAVHTAASFALAKSLYDMFGPTVKSVFSSVKIPGLGWMPTTSIPAYVSETVTGRTYSQLNSAYSA